MKKIVFVRYHDKDNINTRLPESLNKVQGALPPLGLAYIAAYVEKAGYEVKIIDTIADNITGDEYKKILTEEKPFLVVITTMTATIHGGLEAAKIAKEAGAYTCLGGTQLSVYPKETLSYDFIDFGINGEGEEATLKLIQALENDESYEDIEGLIYKKNNEIKINPPAIIEDLDSLPFPARHLLPMEKYSSIIGLHPVTTMIASRGCPFQCGFCFKTPSDKKFRMRSAKNIVDEMESVVKNYKVKEIMFYDDTLTLNREKVVGLCNEIINRNLKVAWESPTRVDTVDYELLKLMKKAGCKRLRYGVESGDENILKLMKKGTDLNKVLKVFQETKSLGIETFAYFIIGYINETPETIKKTINFAKKLSPDLLMFTVATPYPETDLFKKAVEQNYIDRDYWRNFTLGKETERLPYFVEDADGWVQKAYKAFYMRPGYILKQLLKIRTFKDLKKYIQAGLGILFFKMK